MSLESFYHEVALRQAGADRDHLKPALVGWRRFTTLPSTAKRPVICALFMAAATLTWWQHPRIGQHLLGSPSHPPSAADVLAAITRHVSPTERIHRLALACARENDAHACQEALRQALSVAQHREVVSWLDEKEIRALRVNAYFDQFATMLKTDPSRVMLLSAASTRPPVPTPKSPAPKVSATPKSDSSPATFADLPTSLDASKPLSSNFDQNLRHVLGPNAITPLASPSSPQASLNISGARLANPRDAMNEPPIKKNPDIPLFP
jgi:hypothetical protein